MRPNPEPFCHPEPSCQQRSPSRGPLPHPTRHRGQLPSVASCEVALVNMMGPLRDHCDCPTSRDAYVRPAPPTPTPTGSHPACHHGLYLSIVDQNASSLDCKRPDSGACTGQGRSSRSYSKADDPPGRFTAAQTHPRSMRRGPRVCSAPLLVPSNRLIPSRQTDARFSQLCMRLLADTTPRCSC